MPCLLLPRLCRLALILTLLGIPGSAALAIQPVAQNELYEIRLPEFLPDRHLDKGLAAEDLQVSRALGDRMGGDWVVHTRNLRTRSPHYVYGKSQPLGSALQTSQQVEALARQVMADNPEVFSDQSAKLKLDKTPRARGKWAAHFQQTHQGVEVWQGKSLVVFDEASRVLLMSDDAYRDLDLDVTPTLDRAMAEIIARQAVPFMPGVDRLEGDTDLLILPVPVSASEVEHHLVYRVRVRTSDPLGAWVTHVDAHDGTIIWRYNDIHFYHEGGTSSQVQDDTYCNAPAIVTMPYLRLNLGGSNGQTDVDGNWVSSGTTGDLALSADLYGPYCDMNNYTGAEAAYSGSAPEGAPFTVVFDDSNSQQDERDSFDAVSDIHDYFELFAPGWGLTNQRMQTYVSRTDGYCPGNAWWDGTINFCSEGGGYGNTGEIQSVVFHEFGHGVQDAILGWQGSEGLGEGNSDILAILMTNDPALGRGFYLDDCDSGLRDATNTLIYPDNVIGESVHNAGRVLMGFNWKAQEAMMRAYGDEQGNLIAAGNWHDGRVLLQPSNQPDQVFAMFFIDDDDDDLTNGTPNHQYYCDAATVHNFECPEIIFGVTYSHLPLLDTLNGTSPFTVQATVRSTEAAIDDATVALTYRIDFGTWVSTPMTPTGADDIYEAQIPGVAVGIIDYYLSAADVLANEETYPRNAPVEFLTFVVATSSDDMETAGGWTVGETGDDASSGVWVLVDPVATSAQPEDDHTAIGTYCWITGQHLAGQSPGYEDVDSGKTTLLSPVYDLSGYDEAYLRYWKWYSNNRGNAPSQDYWDVLISNDGGASWQEIEHTIESTNAWVGVTVNVKDHFATLSQVQLKFVASDEGLGSLIEAGIDDVMVIAYSAAAPVDDEMITLRPTQLSQNQPNPFNPITEISFNLAKPGPVKLAVYDVTGRLVKTLIQDNLLAGPQSVQWNGTTADSRPVATGVYFYRLDAGGQSFNKRMLLLK